MLTEFPPELNVQILTFLRANDLSALQRTCRQYNDRDLIHTIIDTFANVVYPRELTDGFDTPAVGGEVNASNLNVQFWTYEALRNMEMLVVARILSRPEPKSISKAKSAYGYFVSKSWCRNTLKWLEVQAEERRMREQRRIEAAEAAAAAQQESASASASKNSKKAKYKPKPNSICEGKEESWMV